MNYWNEGQMGVVGLWGSAQNCLIKMCQEIKIAQHNTDITRDRRVCAAVIIIAQERGGGTDGSHN